jgi:hypothetical protein
MQSIISMTKNLEASNSASYFEIATFQAVEGKQLMVIDSAADRTRTIDRWRYLPYIPFFSLVKPDYIKHDYMSLFL